MVLLKTADSQKPLQTTARAYIAVSVSKRKLLDPTIQVVMEILTHFGITPFVFVDRYRFDLNSEKEMMQQAMDDINNCDVFIAEASEKAIGIGVEAGYAKAKGKPVIYLRHTYAEHSTTVSGISDFQIVYVNAEDLKQQLKDVLSELKMAEVKYPV